MAGHNHSTLGSFSKFCIVQDTGKEDGSHGAIVLYSLYQGFGNMNCEYLKRFIKYTKAGDKLKRVPTTEKAMVTVLARHFVPTITSATIDLLMDRRTKFAKRVNAVKKAQFLSENIEHGYGCVDEADYRVMKAVIDDHKSKLQEATKKRDYEQRERPSMIGFVAPVRENDVSAEWAREWMPSKGTSTKDVKLHWRWKAKYPKPTPPYIYSKVWGEATGLSELGALKAVLEKVLSWHEDIYDEPCPWDLDGEQFKRGG